MHEAMHKVAAKSALFKAPPCKYASTREVHRKEKRSHSDVRAVIHSAIGLSFLLLAVILIKTNVVRGYFAVAALFTLAVILAVAEFGLSLDSFSSRKFSEAYVEGELYNCTKKTMS